MRKPICAADGERGSAGCRMKNRWRGFSMLELLVASMLISIFAAVLLNRLSFYQEAAEKANVEYTISALKSALRVQMATMLIEGRARDFALLERQNPMDWLAEKPGDYRLAGNNAAAGDKRAGYWSYDPAARVLTYWPARGEYLQPDQSGQRRIRLHVKIVRDESSTELDASGKTPIVSVVLTLVEPYRWFQ